MILWLASTYLIVLVLDLITTEWVVATLFLINTKFLDHIDKFYEKYVENNKNLFHDDDLWFALYLYLEKKTTIENLIDQFKEQTNDNIIYKQSQNKDIDALHQTIHKPGIFLNRRKIQKIEYIKYKLRKLLN